MKLSKKIIYCIAFATLFCIAFAANAMAASVNISANKTTATVGDSVIITVTAYMGTCNLNVSGSGISESIVYADLSIDTNQTITRTYSLNTSLPGTYTIKLTGDITDWETDVTTNINKAVTVTVTAPVQETTPDTSTDNESSSTNSSNSSSGSTTSNNSTSNTTTTSKSTNAYLSNLGLKTYDFTGFKKSKNEYYVTVPNSVNNVEVYYKSAEASQSVSVSGGKNLVEGTNLIKVTVTAEAGNTNVYKIYVTKKTAEDIEETTPNVVDDSTPESLYLIALSVGNLELSPAFDKSIFEYTAELTEDLTELEVLATANSKTATITIEGNKELVNGENKITITIADETQTITYTIIVNKNVETFDIALLTSIIDNWPFDSNFFDGMSYYLNQRNIFIGIVVICIIYLGIFAGYVVISEQKLISKKTNSFTKYEGSRFK